MMPAAAREPLGHLEYASVAVAHRRYLHESLCLESAQTAGAAVLSMTAFRDPRRCAELLARLGPVLGSPDRRTTASLLSKRLGFLLTGVPLYLLSVCDRGLDLAPGNCLIDLRHDGQAWRSTLPLRSLRLQRWAPAARERARHDLLKQLFAGLITPLWQTLREVGGVPPRMLWENLAVRVYSLYERRLAELEGGLVDAAARRRCEADYRFLLEAEPELFGLEANPLARFHHAKTRRADGVEVRYRRSCCLYYRAACPVAYCQSCPLSRSRTEA
ncbi:IucA/IucC family C-terminal-domain containing protein [Salinicola endophyticus]|uniref:IucA/IucC family C-terminal-domain containing protein n=1 Tax=Salinicola endophyticus TaxID=1949083 RepID=A0AB74U185_9GAMM